MYTYTYDNACKDKPNKSVDNRQSPARGLLRLNVAVANRSCVNEGMVEARSRWTSLRSDQSIPLACKPSTNKKTSIGDR